ncbi:MAG: hypothetical protein ACI822_003221, partial [Gammaproteobacteria bacterium]
VLKLSSHLGFIRKTQALQHLLTLSSFYSGQQWARGPG